MDNLAIVNSAAMNIGVHVSFKIRVFIFFFFDICPGVGLLDHMINSIFHFIRNAPQKGKTLPAMLGDLGLITGSGRSPGKRNGNPFQYSCL